MNTSLFSFLPCLVLVFFFSFRLIVVFVVVVVLAVVFVVLKLLFLFVCLFCIFCCFGLVLKVVCREYSFRNTKIPIVNIFP